MKRRRAILDAAQQLLCHYGARKTTISDIARAAHVAVGSVYLEFDSKDAVLDALARRRYKGVLDAMRVITADQGLDPGIRLQRVMRARLDQLIAQARDGRHASELMCGAGPALQRASAWFVDAQVALLRGLVAEGIAAGIFGPFANSDADDIAQSLILAYRAFAPPEVFSLPPERTVQMLQDMHRLVLRGLLARPTEEGAG